MNYKLSCIFTALLVTFSASYASAQRTMSGRSSLRVSTLFNGRFVSAEAFYEQYTLGGYWNTGLTSDVFQLDARTISVDMADIAASGGYMQRIAATRSRNLNLYVGGGILAGVELLDPLKRMPTYMTSGVKNVDFIYGLYAGMSAEWFWTKRVGAVFQASVPFVFNSYGPAIRWNVGAGIKIVL